MHDLKLSEIGFINILKSYGEASLSDIAAKTSTTRAGVNLIAVKLLKHGIIECAGQATTGGRFAAVYRIKKEG